jgi:transcriptional regulator with XRE-family HTH domain
VYRYGEAPVFVNVGKTLARLREYRGKTLSATARNAGIGKSQLSKYEHGKELPKLESLEKILRALGVGYLDFFRILAVLDRGEDEKPPCAEDVEEVFSRLNRRIFHLHRVFVDESLRSQLQGRKQ